VLKGIICKFLHEFYVRNVQQGKQVEVIPEGDISFFFSLLFFLCYFPLFFVRTKARQKYTMGAQYCKSPKNITNGKEIIVTGLLIEKTKMNINAFPRRE